MTKQGSAKDHAQHMIRESLPHDCGHLTASLVKDVSISWGVALRHPRIFAPGFTYMSISLKGVIKEIEYIQNGQIIFDNCN